MIIIGTTVLNFTQDEGEFYCPTCEGQQSYRKRQGRQFLTLYFIPLIPLNAVGQFIQCHGCRQRYDLSILEYDPEKERAEMLEMYARLLLLVMLHTGRIEDFYRERMQNALQNRFDEGVTDDWMMQVVEEAEAVDAEPLAYAHRIRRTYDPRIAADVLKACSEVLTDRKQYEAEDKEFLTKLGQALGFSANEIATLWTTPVPANP